MEAAKDSQRIGQRCGLIRNPREAISDEVNILRGRQARRQRCHDLLLPEEFRPFLLILRVELF
jgi:hypothetical protein